MVKTVEEFAQPSNTDHWVKVTGDSHQCEWQNVEGRGDKIRLGQDDLTPQVMLCQVFLAERTTNKKHFFPALTMFTVTPSLRSLVKKISYENN